MPQVALYPISNIRAYPELDQQRTSSSTSTTTSYPLFAILIEIVVVYPRSRLRKLQVFDARHRGKQLVFGPP